MTQTTARRRRRGSFRPRLPAEVDRDWQELIAGSEPAERFDPAAVATLPGSARRWLTHAIAPGTPLRYRVELDQHGQIAIGGWRRFEARQVLAFPDGYIWAVTAHLAGMPIHGYDRLSHGTGAMDHRLLGRIPVVSSSGPDHTRGAAGRLAAEIIWVPAAALRPDVTWRAVDDARVTALVPCGGRIHELAMTVAPTGALQRVSVPRWAKVGKGPYREHPFTALFHDEGTFDGYTVPTRTTAGYEGDAGRLPDSAFIRQVVDHARYH